MKRLFEKYDTYVLAFKCPNGLEQAVEILQSAHLEIIDIHSPHYIHIPQLKQHKKINYYGYITGICGLAGFLIMCGLIWYVSTRPLLMLGDIGFVPIVTFIPVLFTATILFAGLGLFITFGMRNHLLPGQQNQVADMEASDDSYVLIISKSISRADLEKLITDLDVRINETSYTQQKIMLPLPLKIK